MKTLWLALFLACAAPTASPAAITTLDLFGEANVTSSFPAKEARSWYRDDSATLIPGESIVSARLEFPVMRGTAVGDVFMGIVDQRNDGGRTGGFIHSDGTDTYQEESSDYFLTALDHRGSPFIYTQLTQLNFTSETVSKSVNFTYDLSPAQVTLLNDYLRSPREGWWAFVLDPDVRFVVTGAATLTLTTAPVPEPSTYVAGSLLLLPFLVQFLRKRSR